LERDAADEAARKEWERGTMRQSRTPSGTSFGRSTRPAANPVVKVLTSATFIRGVLGILKKVM